MSEGRTGEDVFRELELQNPAVGRALRGFRRREEHPGSRLEIPWGLLGPAYRDVAVGHEPVSSPVQLFRMMVRPSLRSLWHRLIAYILLLIGIIALGIAVGPATVRFLAMHWQAILLPAGGVCIGAGVVLLVIRVGALPLGGVAPPNVNTEDPLGELKDLAERTGSRLRAAYRLQLCAVLAVGVIFFTLVVWSMVMVSQDRILYASAFGSGGVAMMILTRWKWQPFDRINQARRLADNADTLATGLRLRMKTLSEITDPSERAKVQWDAVKQYLHHS